MYLQTYKNRNQAYDAIYGKDEQSKIAAVIAIAQRDKELIRQERWDRTHICKHCYMVLPKSGICDCQK